MTKTAQASHGTSRDKRKATAVGPHAAGVPGDKPAVLQQRGTILVLPGPDAALQERLAVLVRSPYDPRSRLTRRKLLKRDTEQRRRTREQQALPAEEQVRNAVARLVGAGAVPAAVQESLVRELEHGVTEIRALPGLLVVSAPAVPAPPQTQDLVDKTALRRSDPVVQRLRQRTVDAVLQGTTWLTSREVGARARPDAANKHSPASRWLDQGRIFAIEHSGQKVFPDYAFDPLGQPIPQVREVLTILHGYPPFRLASWFESSSSRLGGRKPRELLADDPGAVIAAARAHIAGAMHG